MLEDLRRERDDLHEVLRTQFAGDRTEDAGALGIVGRVDDDDRVGIEAQVAAVRAADGRLGANDDGLGDLALLHGSIGRAFLDVHGDDVAHVGVRRLLAHALDEGGFAGAGVVGDVENGAQLDHGGPPFGFWLLMVQALPCSGAEAASCLVLVGTCAATSVSLIAEPSATTAFCSTLITRQRLSRLIGRVSMTSTLSPTLVSFFSSWT